MDDMNKLAQLVSALEEGDISDSGYADLLSLAAKYPAEFKAWMNRR
jgi:hypothetical protein